MAWDCAQLEQRLDDYLDSRLAGGELAAADAHARACPRCAEWFDARQATLLLAQVEKLESPPGLETRILALTLAPAPRATAWAALLGAWRGLQQPRVALGLAAALFSLTLTFNALGISFRDVTLADLNPVNLYYATVRQAHLGYARASRFVNDLRLVYEIRSRLDEMEPEPQAAPPPAPQSGRPTDSPGEKPKEKKSDDSVLGARGRWLLASQLFFPPGVTQ